MKLSRRRRKRLTLLGPLLMVLSLSSCDLLNNPNPIINDADLVAFNADKLVLTAGSLSEVTVEGKTGILAPDNVGLDWQNWDWNAGKLSYVAGQTAGGKDNLMKATSVTAGGSGFAIIINEADLSPYTQMEWNYYLPKALANPIKWNVVSTGEGTETGEQTVAGGNTVGWHSISMPVAELAKLKTLDTTKVIQFALIVDLAVDDVVYWGDLYFSGSVTGPTDPGPTVPTGKLWVITDSAGATTPITGAPHSFTYSPGYDNTITASPQSTGGADGTSAYTRLEGTEAQVWAAGGWQGGPVDLSAYEKLVFWARKTPTAALGSGKVQADSIKWGIDTEAANTNEKEITITDTWAKYEINFTDSGVAGNNYFNAGPDFSQVKVIKYVLPANNVSVDIDEVYLLGSGNEPVGPTDPGPTDPGPTVPTGPLWVITDSAGATTPITGAPHSFTYFPGYENTITVSPQSTGGADGTSAYSRLEGTEAQVWAAGGWGGTPVDLSAYKKLVFWARKTPTAALGSGKVQAGSIKWGIDTEPANTNEKEITITDTWAKYEINFTDSGVAGNNFFNAGPDFSQVKTIKYVLPANNVSVDIDEVYLLGSGNEPVVPTGKLWVITDSAGATTPITGAPHSFTYFPGYDNTITVSPQSTGGADGTSAYSRLEGTEAQVWAAGGWGGTPVDLSAYKKLVFWARKTPTAALGSGKVQAGSIKWGIDTEPANTNEKEITITDTWAKYEINFTDSGVAGNNFFNAGPDFSQVKTIKYVLPANNVSVDIDEVSLE